MKTKSSPCLQQLWLPWPGCRTQEEFVTAWKYGEDVVVTREEINELLELIRVLGLDDE